MKIQYLTSIFLFLITTIVFVVCSPRDKNNEDVSELRAYLSKPIHEKGTLPEKFITAGNEALKGLSPTLAYSDSKCIVGQASLVCEGSCFYLIAFSKENGIVKNYFYTDKVEGLGYGNMASTSDSTFKLISFSQALDSAEGITYIQDWEVKYSCEIREEGVHCELITPAEAFLTITAENVSMLSYPNTGSNIYKLAKHSKCRILRQGRYDVLNGKGNSWFAVEAQGKTGWVYGGNTDMPSDEEWHSENKPIPISYMPFVFDFYSLEKIEAPNQDALFKTLYDSIKKTEFDARKDQEEEGETKAVRMEQGKILTEHFRVMDASNYETFEWGPGSSSLKMINVGYSGGAASSFSFNSSLVSSCKNDTCKVVAEIYGTTKQILKLKNGNLLIVAEYELFNGADQYTEHYLNLVQFDPARNEIINKQKLASWKTGFFGSFRPLEKGGIVYPSNINHEFKTNQSELLLEIKEEYDLSEFENSTIAALKTFDPDFFMFSFVPIKYTLITRFYKYSEESNQFQEHKRESVFIP